MLWPLREDDKEAEALKFSQEATGVYVWRYPWHFEHTQVPLLDLASDMGLFVAGIILREIEAPGSMDGAKVHCVSEWSTPKIIAEDFARAMTDNIEMTEGDNSEVKIRKELLFIDVETEEAYREYLPDFVREGLPHCMALFREHPLFGHTGTSAQTEHDRVFEAVGKRPTTWEEYVKKGGIETGMVDR